MTQIRLKDEWRTVKLGDHVDLVSGFAFESQLFTDKAEDVPLVKGENLHQGYIDWQKAKRWKASESSQYERFQLAEGDVVLAMDRPWIEAGLKFAWIKKHDPRALLVQRVARMRGANGISTDYLRYIIGSPQFTDYIKPIVTGVNVPHISGQQIKDFKFLLPPPSIQHRIAAVLSAYDDFIENNSRRIKILEEMARRIYEEWFVRLRFPGYENSKMVESEFGLIPEGWNVKEVAETFEILGGGTPSTSIREYWENGTINWYSPTDLTRSSTVFMDESKQKISPLGLERSSARLFPAFSIMMTSRATLGVIAINTTDACTNQGFITCIPNENFPLYILYNWLKQNVELFISLGTGSTFKEITKGTFKRIKLSIPSAPLRTRFQYLVEPFMQQILSLQRKNRNLRRTRDLLLPRLISGEIYVSDFPEPEAL